MALAACRECGKRISTEARSCIGCGAPNPTSRPKKTSKDTSTLTFVEKIKFYFSGSSLLKLNTIEGRLISRVQLFEDLLLKVQKRRRKGGKK
jgi:ribosomal protein L40E